MRQTFHIQLILTTEFCVALEQLLEQYSHKFETSRPKVLLLRIDQTLSEESLFKSNL